MSPSAHLWGFNPTLVRLRPSRSRCVLLVISAFQSHAGSIEAGDVPDGWRLDDNEVSIPRWFD